MNQSEAKQWLPILQALADGKEIQVHIPAVGALGGRWVDTDGDVYFSSPPHEYRIKPVPREWWIVKPNGFLGAESAQHSEYAARAVAANEKLGLCEIIKVREVLE